ncbi:hypothetical protein CTAYLR_008509 [Chrysophaeum taylorii]|uniref:Dynamin GTPase n=1 Tax=Chrysophaeum taylorii TaxID=2483200 RepID=A0AAD7UA59_9STRA|nr:hypothetical protein CTAYLR_008509 [Chrysophaeum taylorii]
MGRVRRYKKIKACDPFAKKRAPTKKRREMDLAPEESEVSGRKRRRQERRWAREALGLDENGDLDEEAPKERVVIAPRQSNESERQFRARVKLEGRKIMKEMVESHSVSKQRRKAAMKRRAEAKKAKKRRQEEDEVPSSDIKFGDRVHAPPKLGGTYAEYRAAGERCLLLRLRLRGEEEAHDVGRGRGIMAAAPPRLPDRGRPSTMRGTGSSSLSTGGDSVRNSDIEELIPMVNRLQDALSLTDSKEEISLPQIAVVGGQSSGKSSVLENIVGKSFLPRGSGIVTRRPLVLQLVNGREEYGEFLHASKRFYDFEEIRSEIEADTARVCGTNKGLDSRAIHLKVSSPRALNLTLIDLPGATKVPVGDQPEDIGDQIREMILSYISKPTCIILAVTAANTDLANSDALQLARAVDPRGDRTLGVLTKLDLMDRGTDARSIFTGESTDLPRLKLGYVGVVNRSQADINERKTISDARRYEDDFFRSTPAYADLSLGTAHLVRQCSQLLASHIRATLPTLEREISTTLAKKKKDLEDLGDQGPDAKRRRLTESLLLFCERYQALVTGSALPWSMPGHATRELAGGARVERVFRDVFETEIRNLRVLEDLSPTEVQTLVRNCHGLGGGLFTPDQAFLQLVRRNVRRLSGPAAKCVELVHAELHALIKDAADFPALQAFPDLSKALEVFVAKLLRENLDSAAIALAMLLDMELSRVNITHPDFVGANGITSFMASIEDRITKESQPVQPASAASASAASGGGAPNNNNNNNNNHHHHHRGLLFKGKGPPDPAGKKVMTPQEAAAFRERMIAEAGPPVPKIQRETDPTDRARFSAFTQGLLSTKEKVEVTLICELCASYFAIVRKTFADLVPKAITLKLVDASTSNMTPKVLGELNTEETVESLMSASPQVKELAASLKTSIQALQIASKTLAEMQFN